MEYAGRGGGRRGRPGGLSAKRGKRGRGLEFVDLAGQADREPRRVSGIAEFDRVCGGGLVEASAVLIGGDPGIGKSTLALQAACGAVDARRHELRLHLRRGGGRPGAPARPPAGPCATQVQLAAATNVRDIVAALDGSDAPDVVVVDSIQTMYVDNLESAPGTVGQVRAASQELIRLAKARGFTLLLVGHVTKEGLIAGPKVLEHMVDTVLYFEGERGHQFRILRAVKNRYGATDEIGVFEMTDGGLVEVANPSALFLAERNGQVSGASVFAGMEGTRPVLVEIQALVSASPLATPRRAVVGWDGNRLSMVLAVLEARCGLLLAGKDIYLNVAGWPAGGRAGRRPGGRSGPGVGGLRPTGSGGYGHFRRDRAFRGDPCRRSERAAPEGGRQARLRAAPGRRRAEAVKPRHRQALRDSALDELGHLEELVAASPTAARRPGAPIVSVADEHLPT